MLSMHARMFVTKYTISFLKHTDFRVHRCSLITQEDESTLIEQIMQDT